MEVINYIKQISIDLETIMVNDVIETKRIKNYNEIEKFTEKLTELQQYLIQLNFKKIQSESEPEIKPIEDDIDNEDTTSAPLTQPTTPTTPSIQIEDGKDKYYKSVNNRDPISSEDSKEYTANILRKNKMTFEEFETRQQRKIDTIEILKNDLAYNITREKEMEQDDIIMLGGYDSTYYKVINIDSKKNKITIKEIIQKKIEYINHDYPYGHISTTYYILDKNIIENKIETIPIKTVRGKNKGNQIIYPIIISETGKFVIHTDQDLTY